MALSNFVKTFHFLEAVTITAIILFDLMSSTQIVSAQTSYTHIAPWRQQAIQVTNDAGADQERVNERGRIVDAEIGLPMGYTIDTLRERGIGIGITGDSLNAEELPVQKSDVIAIATFTSYSVHLTPSKRGIYTIENLNIEKVVLDRANRLLKTTSIPVLELGGSAILPSGESITIGIPSSEYSIIPNHKYLVFLNYSPEGAFYDIRKSWDLTTGIATPNSPDDEDRLKSGLSEAAGLSESAILSLLKQRVGK
jgi:hypothetical protein